MEKRPNVVIFNPDEMRWDALYHMGANPAAITPNLDEFASKEAVSFSNAYCQNPVCVLFLLVCILMSKDIELCSIFFMRMSRICSLN